MSEDANWMGFQPHKEDLSKVLGELEADVMRAVWDLREGNVKEIHVEVNRGRSAAITTVATVLDRLHSKGLVERALKKERGIRYEYRPAMSRRQFEGAVVRNVFKGLFETFGDSAISYLVQNSGIEDEKVLKEFRDRLERLKEEAK
jgi:predicted transcriptional regulator